MRQQNQFRTVCTVCILLQFVLKNKLIDYIGLSLKLLKPEVKSYVKNAA